MMMSSIGKAMKGSSVANPKFPSMAASVALFHSTPLLSLKKRVYWPERSNSRGPPRPRFKLVLKRSQVAGIIDKFRKLSDQCQTETPWNWRAKDERTQDSSSKQSRKSSSKSSNVALPDTTSDRLALGLSAIGPINLEDVKIAYRACAVKWHPDHHQGFAKTFAEEKFKVCGAAYQSLCNKLSKR